MEAVLFHKPEPCTLWPQFLHKERARVISFPPDITVSFQDPRVPPWNFIILDTKGLGDDLDSRSTLSFKDGNSEAQERETSSPRSHSRERSTLGSGPMLFFLMPEVFAL